MAEQNSGTKTEKATPKKLRDSRKKGDIAKSKDVTNTLLLFAGMVAFWQLAPLVSDKLRQFTDMTLATSATTTSVDLSAVCVAAAEVLVGICAMIVLPIALFGLLSEFLQTGALFTLEKVKPKLSNLDPLSGVKKMFSLDSAVELLKSIVKIIIVVAIASFTAMHMLPDAMKLHTATPESLAKLLHSQTIMLFGWAMGIFVTTALLDLCYQKYSHNKKLMMSLEDIKREHKSSEGDPQIKGQRQQLAREWAQEGASREAQEATVLVVNPTHIAIAIKYDKQRVPVPTVTARGLGDMAMMMRTSAQEARVPVLRNIPLARKLLADTDNGDVVPIELFDIVAEVISWANVTKQKLSLDGSEEAPDYQGPVPGEDLSIYSPSLPVSITPVSMTTRVK